MVRTIVHADWSVSPARCWAAWARRHADGWRVEAPEPVRDPSRFLAALMAARASGPVLAGFDFPIGMPIAYGRQTDFAGFREALSAFGTTPGWEDALKVADRPEEISLNRPFFPRTAPKGVRRSSLVQGLGLASASDLLRLCERAGPGLRQACPVFWTLGANQVGRAAIAGWRDIVMPAVAAQAALWPFDGPLDTLAQGHTLVVAETYPADAYARLGAAFGPQASKRRQDDRRARADAIRQWAQANDVDISGCQDTLNDGFGAAASGEDAFDALMGALDMIAVATGRRSALPIGVPAALLAWEGWILGRPIPSHAI